MALELGITVYKPNNDELWAKLQTLFEQDRYRHENLSETPDSPGVYLFFSERGKSPIYVGRSKTGLRTRLQQHFLKLKDPNQLNAQQVQKYLIASELVEDSDSAVDYMKENCSFSYIEEAEVAERALLEHFATAVLRTPANLYNVEER